MKHLTFLFLILSLRATAQNVDNPSFDSVYIGGIDRIFEWITSDAWNTNSGDTVQPMNPNDHFVSTSLQYHETFRTVQIEYSSAFHGSLAIKVIKDDSLVHEDGTQFRGFIVNGNHFYTDSAGYIDFKRGGTPFPYRPNLLRGHYKYEDQSPSLSNYPFAFVLLKKYNVATQVSDTIGFGAVSMQLFPTSTWNAFEIPINYFSSQTPDSIVVAFLSSGTSFNTTFWVDSLGFDFSTTSINAIKKEKNDFYQDADRNIHFTDPGQIISVQIFSMNGEVIMKDESQPSILDLSMLAKGSYIMRLEYGNDAFRVYKIQN